MSFWGVTLWSLVGPLAWALHLALVYGVQHMVCAVDGSHALVRPFVLGAGAVLVAALLPFALPSPPFSNRLHNTGWPVSTQQFLLGVMRLLVLLSVVGILWASAGAFFLPGCGPAPGRG